VPAGPAGGYRLLFNVSTSYNTISTDEVDVKIEPVQDWDYYLGVYVETGGASVKL
jgi:hypothetical protein